MKLGILLNTKQIPYFFRVEKGTEILESDFSSVYVTYQDAYFQREGYIRNKLYRFY